MENNNNAPALKQELEANDALAIVDHDKAKNNESKNPPRIEWYCFTIGELNVALGRRTKLDQGCVTWTAGSSMSLKFQGRQWNARRLAYMMYHRMSELSKLTTIIRTCSNPKCIKPEHMLRRERKSAMSTA